MDYLQKILQKTRVFILAIVLFNSLVIISLTLIGIYIIKFSPIIVVLSSLVIAFLLSVAIVLKLSQYLLEPLSALWQIILNLSPEGSGVTKPDIAKLKFSQDLVANLSGHIYQIIDSANAASQASIKESHDLSHNFVASNLPLPLLILDNNENIKFVNQAVSQYLGLEQKDLISKNVYMVMDMAFPSQDTFDNWLKDAKTNLATGIKTWERVKLDVRDNHPTLLFDLAAYYNRDNSDNNTTMLILFDHTKTYSQDEQAISFVALSVHELRTPLTLLRGYIEVFEEELSGKLDPEMQGFMEKMQAQAEQLMAFVNNILNVARVDDNQLELKLEKDDWANILTLATNDLSLRAKVRDIVLNTKIDNNLPPVAVDPISIHEVINNLVDNAIKYSGTSKQIDIKAYLTKDGLIETTVTDYGLGIPTAVLPNLFTKFYRDHHNRSQVGGTGLGLYLSKAIVTAHGGNLWVRSKENEGSTFGFTLVPYDSLNEQLKSGQEGDIVRGAHGWIKNHSLYRR